MNRTAVYVCACVTAALCFAAAAQPAGFRMKVSIDHTKVRNGDHRNFPVLVSITRPELKSVSQGGHVARDTGSDIFFTLADGKTAASELVSYDPSRGELKAWVKVPLLSGAGDTDLCLRYGGAPGTANGRVWDNGYIGSFHLKDTRDPDLRVPDSGLYPADRLTVEAWVEGERAGGEALQPLVSKWSPASKLTSAMFSAYDAGKTDGLETRGYFGAVFDGRYVYFSPQRNGHLRDSVHGFVLRCDTLKDFKNRSAWEAYDAGDTGGMETKGHYGAVFDGRFVYFVPRGRNYGDFTDGQTRILRYDTLAGFKNRSSWSAYDAGPMQSHQSAAFDGRYIYLCPGYEYGPDKKLVESSKIIRMDTRGGFTSPSSYATFDVKSISDDATGCYDGASFDGRFVYFVPLGSGVVVRYDTTLDFGNPVSWKAFDAKPLGMKQNVGATFDGRYLYFDAYSHGVIVRYDTEGGFTDPASWTSRDASQTSGLNTGGFDGGFFDGRYVWFAPFTATDRATGKMLIHSNFLRYDTSRRFDDPAAWDAIDASLTDGLSTGGYNAGAFDGRYFYLAPWRLPAGDYSQVSGNVLRVDTLAGGSGSFSLRYCDYGHNGGLNAAVPGPSFIVNTVNGPASAASHAALVPGSHHLAGVYDGRTVKLYVDGVMVRENPAYGMISKSDADLEIGGIQQGAARFRGTVREVRVSRIARSGGWIGTEFANLADPGRFVRTGAEEPIK